MTKRGFSLIEVLVALSVFTLGLLSFLEITSRSQQLSALTITRTRAALLAQEGVEMAESLSYDSLPAGNYLEESTLSSYGSEFTPFARTVTVQYVDGSLNLVQTDLGMKLISSTVTWTAAAHDVTKLPKTFTIKTIRTNL